MIYIKFLNANNYLGVIISDHNCDRFDTCIIIKRQMRKIRKLFKCSVNVKCHLFKTYCSTMYCYAMWFDSTKSVMNIFHPLI